MLYARFFFSENSIFSGCFKFSSSNLKETEISHETFHQKVPRYLPTISSFEGRIQI